MAARPSTARRWTSSRRRRRSGRPCSRNNGPNADGLGVSLTYDYRFQTSFGGLIQFFSGSHWDALPMTDKTVMNLNPTAQ